MGDYLKQVQLSWLLEPAAAGRRCFVSLGSDVVKLPAVYTLSGPASSCLSRALGPCVQAEPLLAEAREPMLPRAAESSLDGSV